MADFRTPLADVGEKRLPTPTEKEQGMLCGPADRTLFNGLFNRIESEIGEVIAHAGIAGSDADFTQLRQAIQALIDSATGGNPAGYILMTQARARLPIFPDVSNVDGRIVVTQPSTGVVRLPGGVNFVHRGIYVETTVQTDYNTDPSKIYHLRWDPTNGFRLRDLATGGLYNPTGLDEGNPVFDTTYDDMLIARITTNAANAATITNLANKARLYQENELQGGVSIATYGTTNDALTYEATQVYNFSRTPAVFITGWINTSSGRNTQGASNWITNRSISRYGAYARILKDMQGEISPTGVIDEIGRAWGALRFQALTI